MDRTPLPTPKDANRQTRRTFLKSVLGASGLALLAGCAPSTPPTAAPTSAPAAPKPTAAPAAAPTAAPAAPKPTAAPVAPTAAPAAAAATAAPKRGGTLRYAISADVTSLDPQVVTENAGGRLMSMVYSNVTKYQGNEIVGDLAESWESADAKTWMFRLRRGVRFHNGDELTSEDVKFTIERILNPATKASLLGEFSSVGSVEAPDPYSVRIVLKEPNAVLPSLLAMDRGACIVSKKFATSNDLKTKMMGTGPYKFVEQVPGVHIKTVRNDAYFQSGKPYLDGVNWLPYADDTARMTAIRSGAVDVAMLVPPKDIDTLSKEPGVQYHSAGLSTFMFLQFRVDQPPFTNVELRKALNWSVDRAALVKMVAFGHGEPMTGGALPLDWAAASPELKGTYGYDLNKARSILQAAGLGKPKFTLFSSVFAMHKASAEAVHNQLSASGLYDVQFDMAEHPVATQRRVRGEFQVMQWATPFQSSDPNAISRLLETNAYFPAGMRFSDKQIDELLAKGRGTTKIAERKPIYNQIERRMLDLAPYVLLLGYEAGDASRSNVRGYKTQSFMPGVSLSETWLA